ncbi:MAG: TPM domain-containing protein [Pseudomonadota bacterium]|nr:TPM domain-containing protein [Pseudomonadota bacterium]
MRFLAYALLCLLLSLSATRAQQYPAYNDIYVNDFAELLDLGHESILRRNLTRLREDHGIELTVVTIGSMSDYGYEGNIEDFATGLFNSWGVGDATRNDGAMLLVAVQDRVLRIEVGVGYGDSKDVSTKRIIDRIIVPEFSLDNYATGIMEGVDALIVELSGVEDDTTSMEVIYPPGYEPPGFFERNAKWFYAASTPTVTGIAAFFFLRWRRRRPRTCPADGQRMQLVPEDLDDALLSDGQAKEEQLKSVDYDVWECGQCGHRTIEAYRGWFSGYGACRSCKYRTLESESTVLQPATTTSPGRRRVDYECQHCGEAWSATEFIPRKQSSSSSSSSSSSFGGGSSSGGGSSGSW